MQLDSPINPKCQSWEMISSTKLCIRRDSDWWSLLLFQKQTTRSVLIVTYYNLVVNKHVSGVQARQARISGKCLGPGTTERSGRAPKSSRSAEDQIQPTFTRKAYTDSTDMYLLRLPELPTNLVDNCTAPDTMHRTCRQSLPSSL